MDNDMNYNKALAMQSTLEDEEGLIAVLEDL